MLLRWTGVLTLAAAASLYAAAPPAVTPQDTTLTGKVGDTMCGMKHDMAGMKDDECTRECVKMGDHYALIVGDKVYQLNTTDKALLATLDKNAGRQVSVTGTLSADKKAFEVHTISPPRRSPTS